MNETDYVLAYVDYLSHLNGKFNIRPDMLLNVQFCIACTIQLSSMKSVFNLTVVIVLAYVDYLSHRNGKILDLICC